MGQHFYFDQITARGLSACGNPVFSISGGIRGFVGGLSPHAETQGTPAGICIHGSGISGCLSVLSSGKHCPYLYAGVQRERDSVRSTPFYRYPGAAAFERGGKAVREIFPGISSCPCGDLHDQLSWKRTGAESRGRYSRGSGGRCMGRLLPSDKENRKLRLSGNRGYKKNLFLRPALYDTGAVCFRLSAGYFRSGETGEFV